MGGNNSNGNCFAAASVGDRIVLCKAPDFETPVDTITVEAYGGRLALAKAGTEVWPGGEKTPDARQMIEPPEDYDKFFTTGERYAHAVAIGESLLEPEVIVAAQGEPIIAREFMSGANPYAAAYAAPVAA
ncbi:MAG: hypothetical protein ABWY71_03145 [Candidatus Saccharimonadales bacterium]